MAEAKRKLLERYSEAEIAEIIELYASAYGDSGLTAQEVLEEIICDAEGQMNAFATEETERVAGEVGLFLRNVRKAAVNGTQEKMEPVTMRSAQKQERSEQGRTQKEDSAKAKPVGTFVFHYNSIAPVMSIFASDGKGKFTIYDDGTLAIRDDAMQGVNTLEGFRSQGMMELYDIYIDGQKWTQGKDMPTGYYRIESVTQKPTVKKTPGGSYAIDQKGAMRLVDIATKNTTGEGGVKHSRETFMEEAKAFSQEINLWEKEGKQSGQSFIIGSTGEVLQGLGAIESDIYINGDKIKTILMEHQEITLDEIKKIPQILNDPTLILKSRNVGRGGAQNTRMAVYGSVKGKNGMPMMVVFDIRPMENHLVINDMQKVVSAYTKTNDGVSFAKNSFVMYADKKRATSLLRSIGFQMPIELLQSGYIGSITYKQRSVNLYGEKFSDVFRLNSAENKYSREMQSMEELRRVNRALERKLETVQRQAAREIQKEKDAHGITRTPTVNKDDVAAVARRLLMEYGSKSKQWFIREELQKIADAIIGDPEADFSALRDKARLIADNILQGATYDINWEQNETFKALQKELRKTYITVTPSMKTAMGDWEGFRQRHRYDKAGMIIAVIAATFKEKINKT